MAALLVIIAVQRTGSTALAETLAQHPDITNLGEVFHSARGPEDRPDYASLHLREGTNFFRFRNALLASRPELLYPSHDHQGAICEAFLEDLGVATRPCTTIDIKYNSWHHFESIWSMPGDRPRLLQILQDRGAILLHLKRRDLLARYVSQMAAKSRGRYHFDAGEEVPPVKLEIDVHAALADAARVRSVERMFDGWLAGYPQRLHATYEDVFVDGGIESSLAASIGGRIKINLVQASLRPTMQKAVGDLGSIVTNLAEAHAAFAAAGLAR